MTICLLAARPFGAADRPPGAPDALREQLLATLEALEYRPSLQGGLPSAPNRAQGFRTRWSAAGTSLEERTTGAWLMTLRTTQIGRRARTVALGPSTPVITEESVHRAWGPVREWWRNTPAGLEQGWTLEARPPGEGPLLVQVAVDGATPSSQEDGLALTTIGPTLAYGHLQAFDSRGRALPAALAAEPRGWRIEVDDADATYPVTIDPLVGSALQSPPSPPGPSSFGASIANLGDLTGDGRAEVAVGAPAFDNNQSGEGAVFVFSNTSAGLVVVWQIEGGQTDARLGATVAAAGDVNCDGMPDLLVGGPGKGQSPPGTARVYLGTDGGLFERSVGWKFERPDAGSELAASVSGAGDIDDNGCSDVVIGSRFCNNGLQAEGCAFVFLGSDGGLGPTPAAVLHGNQTNAFFGTSVATAGDFNRDGFSDVIIGAPGYGNDRGEGAAFLYFGRADAGLLPPAKVYEPDLEDAGAGSSVAHAGDLNGDGFSDIAVGVPQGIASGTGRVAVLFGTPGVFGPPLIIPAPAGTTRFGALVAGAGDLNGDGLADLAVLSDQGTHGFRGFLVQPPAPPAPDFQSFIMQGAPSELAGADLNGNGFSDLLIGFPEDAMTRGSVTVFPGKADGPGRTLLNAFKHSSTVVVAGAGDVNADGYSDVIVGVPGAAPSDRGAAFLYLGIADGGVSPTPAWTQMGTTPNSRFGASVAAAGDVNGDGFADVVIGAPEAGSASLFLGRRTNVLEASTWTPVGQGASFGAAVAGAGDVDGDGFSDVLVGAPRFSNGEPSEGRALLYRGGDAGLLNQPTWSIESNQGLAFLGSSVSAAGDVNGDGLGDVLIGVPGGSVDGGTSRPGFASLYLATAMGLASTPDWTFEGEAPLVELGRSVASAGDLNEDGFGDVVIGAPNADRGMALAFTGSASGLARSAVWKTEGNVSRERFGASVACAGDVDGDGSSDLIIGAPRARSGEGRASLFTGRRVVDGLTVPPWTTTGTDATNALAVASAGDVNGDGFSDVLVTELSSPLRGGEGLVRLAPGGDTAPGRDLRLAQRFSTQQLGAGARASGPFVVFAMDLKDSLATGRPLRLQVEVKPLGVAFDGGVSGQSEQEGPGAASARLQLAPGRYHWRARIESARVTSRWVPFGANREDEADFVMVASSDGGSAGGTAGGSAGGRAGGEAGGAAGGVETGGGTAGGTAAPPDAGAGPLTFVANGCGCSQGDGARVSLVLALWALARRAGARRSSGA